MTQEQLNRLEFQKRMVASGRMPMTDQVRLDLARAEAERNDTFCGRPEGISNEEWSAALQQREAFRKRMQANGRLPKDSELLLDAKEQLRIEQQHRERVETLQFQWESEREAMKKQYDGKIAALEEEIKNLESTIKTPLD